MSGTSLDGLDIASCTFEYSIGQWKFQIHHGTTVSFHPQLLSDISEAHLLPEDSLHDLDRSFGKWMGEQVNLYCEQNQFHPDLICSHGHTVFHQPEKNYTLQIGSGKALQRVTRKKVICDFRSADVALGGQGAPLVPIGDALLFSEYDYCVNLGGIANISCTQDEKRVAFDVCPVNQVLNFLSSELGLPYDDRGSISKTGYVQKALLDELNNLDFYQINGPKSLGREWVENVFMPIVLSDKSSTPDKLATVCEHISIKLAQAMPKEGSILTTGGGAKNDFLMHLLSERLNGKITTLNDELIIDFKEAMIFAFLGVLKSRNEVNCLSTVTGAKYDHSSGVIFE